MVAQTGGKSITVEGSSPGLRERQKMKWEIWFWGTIWRILLELGINADTTGRRDITKDVVSASRGGNWKRAPNQYPTDHTAHNPNSQPHTPRTNYICGFDLLFEMSLKPTSSILSRGPFIPATFPVHIARGDFVLDLCAPSSFHSH